MGIIGAQLQIFDGVIVTDRYPEPHFTFKSIRTTKLTTFQARHSVSQQIADERRRNYMTSNNPIYNKPTHMELPPTDDTRILEFYDDLFTLDHMLQRNLGRIMDIRNMPELVKGI